MRARRRSPRTSSAPRRRAPGPTRPKQHGARAWTLRARTRPGSPQEAKQESAKSTEAKVKKAADKINLKVEAAEGKIRDAVAAARAEIEAVAADATQDMVARLTGIKVDKKDAADAVKAELNV